MGQRTEITKEQSESTLSNCKPGFYRGHSPVTGGNDAEEAECGHAEWVNGSTLEISGKGRINYWYIPPVEGSVSFCVLLPDTLKIGGYVFSDNYGGCEYHELINLSTMELALLHVYRGDGKLAHYTPGPNWRLKRKLESMNYVNLIPRSKENAGQRIASLWSVSFIPPCNLWSSFMSDPNSIQSGFIGVSKNRVTHTFY